MPDQTSPESTRACLLSPSNTELATGLLRSTTRCTEIPHHLSDMENLKLTVGLARHDPLVVLGFLLFGLCGWASAHILLKLVRAGYDGPVSGRPIVTLPRKYLEVRAAHGWSPWPAYLVWISVLAGAASLAVGLFRLPN